MIKPYEAVEAKKAVAAKKATVEKAQKVAAAKAVKKAATAKTAAAANAAATKAARRPSDKENQESACRTREAYAGQAHASHYDYMSNTLS